MPPLRLELLKHVLSPRYNTLGCQDPDCIEMNCDGNRFEVLAPASGTPSTKSFCGIGEVSVRLHIVHSKNDRRPCRAGYRVRFDVPLDSDLTKLLLIHIKAGRKLLTLEKEDAPLNLFVSRDGNAFSSESGFRITLTPGLFLSYLILCPLLNRCHLCPLLDENHVQLISFWSPVLPSKSGQEDICV